MRIGCCVVFSWRCLGWTDARRTREATAASAAPCRTSRAAAMPGVTVTATSPTLLSPAHRGVRWRRATTGSSTCRRAPTRSTAELTGFSIFRREGILLRAGANFQVDIDDGARHPAGDDHRDRRLADARGVQSQQRAQHRRGVPEDAAARRRQVLERLPAHDAGRDVAPAQRRQRTAELLRQRGRSPRRRRRHGRDDGEQLQRLEHQPHRRSAPKPSRTSRSRPAASTRPRRWATGWSST